MNPRMREFFRQKLLAWRAELVKESNDTLQNPSRGRDHLSLMMGIALPLKRIAHWSFVHEIVRGS